MTEREDAGRIYNKIAEIGSAYICLHGDRFCASPEYAAALQAKIDEHVNWRGLPSLTQYKIWREETGGHWRKLLPFGFHVWRQSKEQSLYAGRKFAVEKLAEISAGLAVLNNMADNYKAKHKKSWRLFITDDNLAFCLPPDRG